MAASPQTFNMASSLLLGEENMTDAQFVKWCNDQLLQPEYSTANFENAMLYDKTVPWGQDWTEMDWCGSDDTQIRTGSGAEMNAMPLFINLPREPAENIATEPHQDGEGISVISGSDETDSIEEPRSTGEPESRAETESPKKSESPESPESPEEPASPEGSESPENPEEPEPPQSSEEPESPEVSHSPKEPESPEEPQSPEEPVDETAPGLVQDKEFIAREEHKTENLLDLRTRLHKGFFTKKGRKECQMSDMLSLLQRLELHFGQLECLSYEERLEYISRDDVRAAKLDVVLRAINRQEGIPLEFKGHAASLLAKWGCIRGRRVKAVKSALQCKAEPIAPLMVDLTESCESSTNPRTPSLQRSDDETDGVVLNTAWNIVVIDPTESCKPVVISETPNSQAIVDCNQSSRSASLVTNDDKPPIDSVTAGENPTARDVPSSKGGKRKSPASERSASELQPVRRERQPKRKATSVTQYITAETKFVDEGQLEIDKIIGAINAYEPPAIIIRELKRLKSRFVSFGDLRWSR